MKERENERAVRENVAEAEIHLGVTIRLVVKIRIKILFAG